MEDLAAGLAEGGLRVVRFEFPYMAKRRSDGKKRPPDRLPVLLETWRSVVGSIGRPQRLVIGGKSMGGRIASLLADELGVRGLVCCGYPFHPPGKPESLRTQHLLELSTPTLILQGERDPFGKPDEVASYGLSNAIRVEWLADGDHGFKPRKASGLTEADNLATAIAAIDDFTRKLA